MSPGPTAVFSVPGKRGQYRLEEIEQSCGIGDMLSGSGAGFFPGFRKGPACGTGHDSQSRDRQAGPVPDFCDKWRPENDFSGRSGIVPLNQDLLNRALRCCQVGA